MSDPVTGPAVAPVTEPAQEAPTRPSRMTTTEDPSDEPDIAPREELTDADREDLTDADREEPSDADSEDLTGADGEEPPDADREDLAGADGEEPTLDALFRRQGLIAGWLIAWPFFLLTASAGAIATAFQWMQRPQLVPFTIGLYLCMGFFAYAYSVAWRYEARIRQMLAMVATITILIALVALHLDDGAERWVYLGDQRVLRPAQPLLRTAVALDIIAIIIIAGHGLGLGLGNRFFLRESGQRVSRAHVREMLRRAGKIK